MITEIRLSPTEYEVLAEHAPIMIWRAGIDAACDYFNTTWLKFTGRTFQEECGDGWSQGVHPEDLERCLTTYREAFKRHEPFEMRYRLRRRDGQYRLIFDRGVPMRDARGDFSGYIGSCVDITEWSGQDTERA